MFLILSCMSCLFILEINPLLVASFANIFSLSKGCLFVLLAVSFPVQSLSTFIESHLFILVFIFTTLGGRWKRTCCNYVKEWSIYNFIVPGLTFRSLNYLSSFLCVVLGSIFIPFFYTSCPVFLAPLIEETVFSPLYILVSFVID